MHGMTQIDAAGRLVVPKAMRDALHLRAGDRLRVRTEGETLVLEAEPVYARLRIAEDGWPIAESRGPGDPMTAEAIRNVIDQVREERIQQLLMPEKD